MEKSSFLSFLNKTMKQVTQYLMEECQKKKTEIIDFSTL